METLPHLRCPLCGGPNDCAVAHAGRFDTDCWCRHVSISPTSLALVPQDEIDRSCLCRRCAKAPPGGDGGR